MTAKRTEPSDTTEQPDVPPPNEADGSEPDSGQTGAGPEAAPGDPGDEQDVEREGSEVERRIAEMTEELEAARDRHLRLAAEFDNFRKRAIRERTGAHVRAQAELVESMLEALDDLHRFSEETDPESTSAEALVEGMEMIKRKLLRSLEAAGLEEVEPQGEPFDPEEHEALMTEPAESEEEDDIVSAVFQRGYRFGDRLIRPARVRVKKL